MPDEVKKRHNYTPLERRNFLRLIKQEEDVITSVKHDEVTRIKKEKAWKTIVDRYNKVEGHRKRDLKQLKKLLKNIKLKRKRNVLGPVHKKKVGKSGGKKIQKSYSDEPDVDEIMITDTDTDVVDSDTEYFRNRSNNGSPTKKTLEDVPCISFYECEPNATPKSITRSIKNETSSHSASDLDESNEPASDTFIETGVGDSTHQLDDDYVMQLIEEEGFLYENENKNKWSKNNTSPFNEVYELKKHALSEEYRLKVDNIREEHNLQRKIMREELNLKLQLMVEEHSLKQQSMREVHNLKQQLMKEKINHYRVKKEYYQLKKKYLCE